MSSDPWNVGPDTVDDVLTVRLERQPVVVAEPENENEDDLGLEIVAAPELDDEDLDEGPLDEFDLDHFGDDEEWDPSMGFPDPYGVLIVWVDEDNLINRVRISPHWRTKLGQHTLLDAIGPVFLMINNHQESVQSADLEIDEVEAPGPLTWEGLAELREQAAELSAQLDALPEGVRAQYQGEWTHGDGLKGKVRIVLNPLGRLATIGFDEKWLATARIKELSDGIVEAHRAARAAHQPPTIEPSERDVLIAQLTTTRNQLAAMIRRGFQ